MDGIFAMFAESCGLDEGFESLGNEMMFSEAELAEEMEHLEEIEDVEVSDDLMEACFESMLINEQNYNNIMNAVAYDEMKAYVESGNLESLNEEGRLKSFFDMIKKWLDRAWQKIKSIFNKAIAAIEGWVRTDKSMLDKHEKDIAGYKGKCEVKGYDIDSNALKAPIYSDLMSAFINVANMYVEIKHTDTDTKTSTSDYKYNVGKGYSRDTTTTTNSTTTSSAFDAKSRRHSNSDTETVCKMLRGKALGTKNLSADEFKDELKKKFKVNGDKVTLSYNGSAIVEELKTGKATKISVKAGYNLAKSMFAGYKKYFAALEKSAKAKNKDAKNNYGLASSLAKCGVACCSTAQRIHIGALNTYHRQCRAMAAVAIRGKKAVNASADMFDDEDNGERFAFIV